MRCCGKRWDGIGCVLIFDVIEVNQFMTKEGVPAGADGFIDNAVNQEFNKFT